MSVLARPRPSFRSATSQARGDRAPARGSGGRKGLDSQLQSVIGEQLRRYYADLLREPVPQRLLGLVDKLKGAEGERS